MEEVADEVCCNLKHLISTDREFTKYRIYRNMFTLSDWYIDAIEDDYHDDSMIQSPTYLSTDPHPGALSGKKRKSIDADER